MEIVTKEHFEQFVCSYGGSLVRDITGICEPAFVGYYDFSKEVGIKALVAGFHLHPNESQRVYRINKDSLA